ncbi:MAG: cation:proton antiporter, partial [Candidatus Micrarchaeota archaeon]
TESLLLGVIFISSSTTIALKMLEELVGPKNQKEEALAKAAIVIEDLYGFAALAFVLAYIQTGAVSTSMPVVIEAVLASVAMLAMLFFMGVNIMPKIFYLIEKFFPGSAFSFGIAFCLFLSYAVISLNVSPLIGAFLAGTILTSTIGHKDVLKSIIPIRNLFATLFFVSIGMLINPNLLISILPVAIIISVVAILSKAVPFTLVLMRFGVRQKDAVPLGVITGPRGEISLVIAQTAIFSELAGQHFLAIATGLVLLTAIISPVLLLSVMRLKSFKGLLGV